MKSIAAAATLLLALGAGQALSASFDDLNTGIHLHNLNQRRDAIAAFDKALSAGDLSATQQFIAHLDRGMDHQAMMDYDLALIDYSASLALQPNNAGALFQRANAYLTTGKFAEAGSDLDALIAQRPMLAQAYVLRVPVDARLNKIEQIAADSKKVLALMAKEQGRSLETGITAWQAGETSMAEDNFTAAASQGDEAIYGWLWLALVELKIGKPVPKEKLPAFDANAWPAPIVGYFTGDAGQESVFAAAGDGEDFLTRGRICEANFYVGEWLLQHHDAATAQPLIQKAAGICPMDFVEWGPAQTELAEFAP